MPMQTSVSMDFVSSSMQHWRQLIPCANHRFASLNPLIHSLQSLLKAIRALRQPVSQPGVSTAVSSNQSSTQNQLTVHIELQQVKQSDDGSLIRRGGLGKDDFNQSYLEVGKSTYPSSDRPMVLSTESGGDQVTLVDSDMESDGARDFQRQI
jgi:hypothetical protein